MNTKMGAASLEHAECVSQAAADILLSACDMQVATLEEDSLYADPFVLAVISLIGDVEWTIFLGFPQPTAAAVASKFAGFDIPADSPDVGDAVGELANVIAGNAKNRLDRMGLNVQLSLPCVILDGNLKVLIPRGAPFTKTCFSSPAGKLLVGVFAKAT